MLYLNNSSIDDDLNIIINKFIIILYILISVYDNNSNNIDNYILEYFKYAIFNNNSHSLFMLLCMNRTINDNIQHMLNFLLYFEFIRKISIVLKDSNYNFDNNLNVFGDCSNISDLTNKITGIFQGSIPDFDTISSTTFNKSTDTLIYPSKRLYDTLGGI